MIITSKEEVSGIAEIVVMTSIGGSPIHEGHIRLLRDCKKRAYINHVLDRDQRASYVESFVKSCIKLLVIVNCDDFLIRKHGFSFQNENARAEIIDSIKDVDYTYVHHSNKQTIDDAINYFKPAYLCKGGDRSSTNSMPPEELEACEAHGTKIIYGVGGTEKAESSSSLIRKAVEYYRAEFNDDYREVCGELSEILCDIPYRPKIADKLGL